MRSNTPFISTNENLIPSSSPASSPASQKRIVQQLAQINILRAQMLKQAQDFTKELTSIQFDLQHKANELQILTCNEMDQISKKNLKLMKDFVKHQQDLIESIETKNTNWNQINHELQSVQVKFEEVLSKNDFVSNLVKTELLKIEINSLLQEVQQLKKEKETFQTSKQNWKL